MSLLDLLLPIMLPCVMGVIFWQLGLRMGILVMVVGVLWSMALQWMAHVRI